MSPAGPMEGGMMEGGMMENMRRMMGAGMRPSAAHLEGRLVFLGTELRIADAQAPQWNSFADTVRENAKRMAEAPRSAMSPESRRPSPSGWRSRRTH